MLSAPTQLLRLKYGKEENDLDKNTKTIIISAASAVVVIAAIVAAAIFIYRAVHVDTAALQTQNPVYASVEDTISATGIIKNKENYTITSAATGKVIECGFEAGDYVTAGQVLYRIDSDALSRQLEQAKINLETARVTRAQSAKAAADLSVKAYVSGLVGTVYVHKGDMIQAGAKIADVTDSQNLILKAPFNATDIPSLYAGAAAEVTLASTGGACAGTVKTIYSSSQAADGGKAVTTVEIAVSNPGAVKSGEQAYVRVGNIASASAGTFENSVNQSIVASASGQVDSIRISEGTRISAGQTALTLKNDAVTNAVTNADLQIKQINSSIAQLTDQLDDYTVKSPIDGIVTSKTVKLYDNNAAMTPMAVISDTSHLYAEVQVDELNAPRVQVGQTARITTQDASGASYTGVVTQTAEAGVPANGITYYPVKIMLDESAGLIDGMNVDASVIADRRDNTLTVPTSAIKGGKVKLAGEKGIEERLVETGIKNKEITEILSGLNINDKIVVGGESHE